MSGGRLECCPFCGHTSAPRMAHRSGNAVVVCWGSLGGCGACGEAIASDDPYAEREAIAAWNRRTDTAAREEVARLRSALRAVDAMLDVTDEEADDTDLDEAIEMLAQITIVVARALEGAQQDEGGKL